MRSNKYFQPVAKRLNKILLRIGLALMLIIIMLHAGNIYFDISEGLRARIVRIVDEHHPRLSAALWDIDPLVIDEELDRLAAIPSLAGVVLTTAGGARYERGRVKPANHELIYTVSLLHKSSTEPVGTLNLIADRSAIWKQVGLRMLPFIISQLLFVALILIALQLLLRKMVLRRLDALSVHTHLLRADHLDEAPPPPLFTSPVQDELDYLLEGFASLQSNLLLQQKERGELIQALAESRDQLEAEVAQRTGESLYLSGFLHMLSKEAERYLNLHLDCAEFGLEQTLSQTGVLLGLDSLMAVCFADGVLEEEVYLWHRDGRLVRDGLLSGARELYPLSANELNHQPVFILHDLAEIDPDCGEAALCRDLQLVQLVALPLDFNAERLGILFIGLSDPLRQLSKLELRLLPMVAGLCSNVLAHHRQQLALQLAKNALLEANAQLAQQASHDALTGIANRRAFDERITQEMRRAMRNHQPLLLVILDIDFFKQYNDYFGHGAGDVALKQIAGVLAEFTERAGDCAARIGGEEFALLLPDTDLIKGRQLAEELRLKVISLGISQGDGLPLTISQGLAVFRGKEEVSMADFLHAADQALYQAKRNGRNQLQLSGPAADTP